MVFSSLRNLGGGGTGVRAGGTGTATAAPVVTQPGREDDENEGDDNWQLPSPDTAGTRQGGGRGGGGGQGNNWEAAAPGEEEGGQDGRGDNGTMGDSLASTNPRENSVVGGAGVAAHGGSMGGQGGGKPIGFSAVLQTEGWNYRDETTVGVELQWQRVVNGETARNDAFTERVLGLQEFKAFAFMKAGSPWVQIGHGFGKFYSIYGTVPELDGKVLMFVGDRGWTRDPVAVQPPVQNTWKWISVNVVNDTDAIMAAAQGDGGNGLWQSGGGNNQVEEVKVPYILALPGVLMEYVYDKGGQCRPHELLLEMIRLSAVYHLPVEEWSLVRKWCVVAAQAKADGDSHIALKLLPAFSADKSFLDWCERRIDTTMGIRVREIGGDGGGTGGHAAHLVATTAQVVQKMGTEMVAGFQQAMQATVQQGGAGLGEGSSTASGLGGFGKKYSRSHIAQLKGFCRSEDVTRIPSIWYTFSTTRDFDLYRGAIERKMEKFSKDKGVEIDLGMYLEDESLKAIAQLQFNPSGGGAGVALAQSADKGLSILLCRPRSLAEIERVRDEEQATDRASGTVTVEQARKLKPGAVCRPPNGTYLELRLLVGTYCGLLYTLFGSGCDYYHQLRKIHTALSARDVSAIRGAFTVDKCRRIIWAIIDDGRAFFRQKMSESDFTDPDGYSFPTSLLSSIFDQVRLAHVIERAFYPKAWMVAGEGSGQNDGATRGRSSTSGGQGAGGGGGGTYASPTRQGMMTGSGSGGGGNQRSSQGGGASGTANRGGGWIDDRHPVIKSRMSAYEGMTGLGLRINLGQLLTAAKRDIRDLPVLPEYVANGRPYLCWAHVLGRCHFGDSCSFARGHPPRRDIPDAFAREVVEMLGAGIDAMVEERRQRGGGSPIKKQKSSDE